MIGCGVNRGLILFRGQGEVLLTKSVLKATDRWICKRRRLRCATHQTDLRTVRPTLPADLRASASGERVEEEDMRGRGKGCIICMFDLRGEDIDVTLARVFNGRCQKLVHVGETPRKSLSSSPLGRMTTLEGSIAPTSHTPASSSPLVA